MPIRFAHTIVEDPKYGASRRDAVISVASAPIPAPKTSAPSARLPGLPSACRGTTTTRARRRARSRRASAPQAPPQRRERARARSRSGALPTASRGASGLWLPGARDGTGRRARPLPGRVVAPPREPSPGRWWARDWPQGDSRNRIPRRAACPAGAKSYSSAMDSPEGRGRMAFAGAGGLPGLGGRLTFLFGLLLALSALTGWYTGEGNGTTVSVIGWHTGTIGKIVLFLGLVAVLLVVLREVGVDMPAAVPESLVTIAVGSVATILVLVRIISIPDSFFFASRGIGIWISLACAIGIILAGLLEASEEL